jgi:hypothetical protein
MQDVETGYDLGNSQDITDERPVFLKGHRSKKKISTQFLSFSLNSD